MRFRRTIYFLLLVTSGCVSSGKKAPSLPAPSFHLPSPAVSWVKISVLHTGYTTKSEALVLKGGKLFRKHRSEHVCILIDHPNGKFLFETGLGKNVDQQLNSMSVLHRKIFAFNKLTTAREQMIAHGIYPDSIQRIFVSHMHWDHVSAVEDFPLARIITTKAEFQFALSNNAHAPAFLKNQYVSSAARIDTICFNAIPFGNFQNSFDLYNDGSIVFVPLCGGHTPGSLGMLVTLASKKRLFFVGDLVWSSQQIETLKSKNFFAQKLVDHNRRFLKEQILLLHKIKMANPDIIIVPSHDYEVLKELAEFPKFE